MIEKRSIVLTIIIVVIVIGASALYTLLNRLGSENLSASLPLPELEETIPVPRSTSIVEIAEAEISITEEAVGNNLEAVIRDEADEVPRVAGEIDELAITSTESDQGQLAQADVAPTAATGLGTWSLPFSISLILLGLLGLYLAPKISALR